MTKTSKNKSKQRNWFQTQPYFVGSVFRLVKWHHFFFCRAQVFLSILLLGQVSSFAALHPFQLSWLCSFYVVFTFFSWLSQSSHYLRLLSAQNASLPLKEFLCSGRNLLALLENRSLHSHPTNIWTVASPLMSAFTPETSCAKAELSPSDVLNE